jgi:hypothetical protein
MGWGWSDRYGVKRGGYGYGYGYGHRGCRGVGMRNPHLYPTPRLFGDYNSHYFLESRIGTCWLYIADTAGTHDVGEVLWPYVYSHLPLYVDQARLAPLSSSIIRLVRTLTHTFSFFVLY